MRDSPALDVAQILHGQGACVTVYDPVAVDNARKACPQLRYATSAREAAIGAQVVLVLTEWPEFGILIRPNWARWPLRDGPSSTPGMCSMRDAGGKRDGTIGRPASQRQP